MTDLATTKDWWDLVDENWQDLLGILWRLIPLGDLVPERLCIESTPNPVSETGGVFHMAQEVQRLKDTKNPHLCRWFSAAWNIAPDSPEIHYIPGWDVFCTLLSEEWALHEDPTIAQDT